MRKDHLAPRLAAMTLTMVATASACTASDAGDPMCGAAECTSGGSEADDADGSRSETTGVGGAGTVTCSDLCGEQGGVCGAECSAQGVFELAALPYESADCSGVPYDYSCNQDLAANPTVASVYCCCF